MDVMCRHDFLLVIVVPLEESDMHYLHRFTWLSLGIQLGRVVLKFGRGVHKLSICAQPGSNLSKES